MSRRGRPVAGTSAKKARIARRHARGEADRLRRAGATPPATVTSPEDLAQVARQHRQQQEPKMTDRLRPDVVAALSEPQQLPAALVDRALDATPAEREAAAAVLADRTRVFLEQAGALRPSTSVLDLHHDQVQLLAAVYGIIGPWWRQRGWRDRPLGHMLKVVPADVATQVAQLLRWVGLLPPEPPQPER